MQRLCETLPGITCDLPRVHVFGAQSNGKSTIIEMILNFLKINFVSDNQATSARMINTIIRLPRDRPGKADDWKVKINGKPVNVNDAAEEIASLMEEYKKANAAGISEETIDLTVETTCDDMHSLSVIDHPGFKAKVCRC